MASFLLRSSLRSSLSGASSAASRSVISAPNPSPRDLFTRRQFCSSSSGGFKDTSSITSTWWKAVKVFNLRTAHRIVRRVFSSRICSTHLISFMERTENLKQRWMAHSKGEALGPKVVYTSANDAFNDLCSVYVPLLTFFGVSSFSVSMFLLDYYGDKKTAIFLQKLANDRAADVDQLRKLNGTLETALQRLDSCESLLKKTEDEKEKKKQKKKKTEDEKEKKT